MLRRDANNKVIHGRSHTLSSLKYFPEVTEKAPRQSPALHSSQSTNTITRKRNKPSTNQNKQAGKQAQAKLFRVSELQEPPSTRSRNKICQTAKKMRNDLPSALPFPTKPQPPLPLQINPPLHPATLQNRSGRNMSQSHARRNRELRAQSRHKIARRASCGASCGARF